jgi:hypothetical protein
MEDPGAEGRIILRLIFKKEDEGMDLFIWIRIGRGGGLVNAVMNFRVP